MPKQWNELFKSKYFLIISVAILGILLIFFSNFQVGKSEVNESSNNEEYLNSLEKRIEEIVETIDGAGDCKVMINASSTYESVYVKDVKKSSDADKSESENIVLTMKDGNGNQTALMTKQLMPEITGVIVTCSGGGDLSVRSLVTNAVCTVLGIGANNVCVIAKS